jgi:arachidonate 15-lipoxygenase
MHPRPTLPSQAPNPAERADAIARARDAYQYDWSYALLCFVQDLPFWENFTPHYLARGAEVTLRLQANRAATQVGGWLDEITKRAPAERTLESWAKMFPTLPQPLAVASWREDWCFAWQRLSGPCPVLIQRIDRLPPSLPLGDAELRRITGQSDASIDGALAAKRLYVVDYAVFDGVKTGVTDGAAKFLWAPVVLLLADATVPGGLRPLAIQTGGQKGTKETLYLPGDRDWMLARTAAQIADENMQGVLVHLGWCHMVIQRFILAAHRQLSVDHPLMVLLAPHIELTLAVNQVAKKSVVNPGGVQDRLLAPEIDAQMALLHASVGAIDLAALDPTVDFARRGVADREALPVYPFRDDSLLLWDATRAFVEAYVRLYYASDDEVVSDGELAAFVREVGADDGGRLPKLVEGISPKTVGDVVDLMARVIFRATTYHAAINDSNYDWAAYVPNMPTAGFAALPPRATATEADLATMLPSVELGWETITATYQVAELQLNHFGRYPKDHFVDPRVGPLVQALQARLDAIETQITERNASRPVPYTFLLPSKITASINA